MHRRIAKTGLQARIGTEYLGRCAKWHPDVGTHITFARYHNPGQGYWVQLTLTRRTAQFDPLQFTPHYEESWLLAFFGPDRNMVRTDLASSDFGRRMGTRHYRLFTDETFKRPYIPQRDLILD